MNCKTLQSENWASISGNKIFKLMNFAKLSFLLVETAHVNYISYRFYHRFETTFDFRILNSTILCCTNYYQKLNVCVGKFLRFLYMIYYYLFEVDEYEDFEQRTRCWDWRKKLLNQFNFKDCLFNKLQNIINGRVHILYLL